MNIKLMEKYRDIFLWMFEDTKNRRCKYKDVYGSWVKAGITIFNHERKILGIVKDDEYVTLAIALAEGKTIQHKHSESSPWYDLEPKGIRFSLNHPMSYRIKPDDASWIRHLDGTEKNSIICETECGIRRIVDSSKKDRFFSVHAQFSSARPITPDDLHHFQLNGWIKIDVVLKKLWSNEVEGLVPYDAIKNWFENYEVPK